MSITRRLLALSATAILLSISTGCGSDEPKPLEMIDLTGRDAGGDGDSTTFLLKDGDTEKYMTLAFKKGHFGTHSNGVFTRGADFTWTLDDAGVATITYYVEAETFSARAKKTETFNAANEGGKMTLTSADGKKYTADAKLLDPEEYIIKTYIEGRTYRSASGGAYNFETKRRQDGKTFEWDLSDSSILLYVVYEDDTYDILEQENHYTLVDREGRVFEWEDAPIYVKDEHITEENLAGTWKQVDGDASFELKLADYELDWLITGTGLTAFGEDFGIEYDNDAKEVHLLQIGSTIEYRSDDAAICDLY